MILESLESTVEEKGCCRGGSGWKNSGGLVEGEEGQEVDIVCSDSGRIVDVLFETSERGEEMRTRNQREGTRVGESMKAWEVAPRWR